MKWPGGLSPPRDLLKFEALAIRKVCKKFTVALAHKMLRTIYAMLAGGILIEAGAVVNLRSCEWRSRIVRIGFARTSLL